ncbi:hypothetical protein Q6322_29695, partial [Klebsiella pneumoniae]|uniref:hypothetical protein n=1 Tax=Klebsiella pneumoniae TaxID=573 RepID=UPI0027300712
YGYFLCLKKFFISCSGCFLGRSFSVWVEYIFFFWDLASILFRDGVLGSSVCMLDRFIMFDWLSGK